LALKSSIEELLGLLEFRSGTTNIRFLDGSLCGCAPVVDTRERTMNWFLADHFVERAIMDFAIEVESLGSPNDDGWDDIDVGHRQRAISKPDGTVVYVVARLSATNDWVITYVGRDPDRIKTG